MNSIHEALCFGVPCLMCPQQGEQRLFMLLERMKTAGEETQFWQLKDDPEKLRKKYEEYHL